MVCARWNRVSILDSIARNCEAMASSDCFVVVAVSLHSVRMCLYLYPKKRSLVRTGQGLRGGLDGLSHLERGVELCEAVVEPP